VIDLPTDSDDLPNEEEMGRPVAELRELNHEARAGFVGRVISSLGRRTLVSQFATFSWSVVWEAAREILQMAFSLLGFERSDNGEED